MKSLRISFKNGPLITSCDKSTFWFTNVFQSQEVSSTASCLQSQEVTYTELQHGNGGRRGYAQMTMTPSPSSCNAVANPEMMALQHTHSMQRRFVIRQWS